MTRHLVVAKLKEARLSENQIRVLSRLFDLDEAFETMCYWLRESNECQRIANLSLEKGDLLTDEQHQLLKIICRVD